MGSFADSPIASTLPLVVLPHLHKLALANNSQALENKRIDIATQLFEAYSALSCCCILPQHISVCHQINIVYFHVISWPYISKAFTRNLRQSWHQFGVSCRGSGQWVTQKVKCTVGQLCVCVCSRMCACVCVGRTGLSFGRRRKGKWASSIFGVLR